MAVTKVLLCKSIADYRLTVPSPALQVVLITASEPTKQLNRLQHLCHRQLIMYIGVRTSQYTKNDLLLLQYNYMSTISTAQLSGCR